MPTVLSVTSVSGAKRQAQTGLPKKLGGGPANLVGANSQPLVLLFFPMGCDSCAATAPKMGALQWKSGILLFHVGTGKEGQTAARALVRDGVEYSTHKHSSTPQSTDDPS